VNNPGGLIGSWPHRENEEWAIPLGGQYGRLLSPKGGDGKNVYASGAHGYAGTGSYGFLIVVYH
jgi:hypothetical protein